MTSFCNRWRPGQCTPFTIFLQSSLVYEGWYRLTAVLNFWLSKTISNSTQFIEIYSGVSEQIKPLQLVGQAAEFKFESSFKPLPVTWQSLPKELTAEINGRALGAAIWHSLGGSDGQAQTQGDSESTAVAASRHRLAWGKSAITLAMPTFFDSQKSSGALQCLGHDDRNVKWNFWWISEDGWAIGANPHLPNRILSKI